LVLLELETGTLRLNDGRRDDEGDDREGLEGGSEGAVVGEASVGEDSDRESDGKAADETGSGANDRRALVGVGLFLSDDLEGGAEWTDLNSVRMKSTFMTF
jgi:hypothetical protein